MNKKYEVDYDFKARIVVEIDHDIMTEEKLHEINSFWSNDKSRLDAESGSVLDAVLKMLAQCIFCLEIERNVTTAGIVRLFDWGDRNGGQEGWPKMDGSAGIKVTDVEGLTFAARDMDVTERTGK